MRLPGLPARGRRGSGRRWTRRSECRRSQGWRQATPVGGPVPRARLPRRVGPPCGRPSGPSRGFQAAMARPGSESVVRHSAVSLYCGRRVGSRASGRSPRHLPAAGRQLAAEAVPHPLPRVHRSLRGRLRAPTGPLPPAATAGLNTSVLSAARLYTSALPVPRNVPCCSEST